VRLKLVYTRVLLAQQPLTAIQLSRPPCKVCTLTTKPSIFSASPAVIPPRHSNVVRRWNKKVGNQWELCFVRVTGSSLGLFGTVCT